MSRYKKEQQEVNKRFAVIEPSELDQLRADLSAKKQERMNGRLQPRFFQVMFDRGVLKLMENGDLMVMKPVEYTKWNRANSMIESADTKEQERLFKENPELEVEWNEKVQRFLKETRRAVFGLSRKLNQQTGK